MKNVTITLDEETARWARIAAAYRGTSVSRLVGEILREHCQHDAAYEAAAERFLQRRGHALKGTAERYPTREELHDRDLLR